MIVLSHVAKDNIATVYVYKMNCSGIFSEYHPPLSVIVLFIVFGILLVQNLQKTHCDYAQDLPSHQQSVCTYMLLETINNKYLCAGVTSYNHIHGTHATC